MRTAPQPTGCRRLLLEKPERTNVILGCRFSFVASDPWELEIPFHPPHFSKRACVDDFAASAPFDTRTLPGATIRAGV